MSNEIRLVAMNSEQAERLRPIAESTGPNSDLARSLAASYEEGIDAEEADIASVACDLAADAGFENTEHETAIAKRVSAKLRSTFGPAL